MFNKLKKKKKKKARGKKRKKKWQLGGLHIYYPAQALAHSWSSINGPSMHGGYSVKYSSIAE